MGYTTDFMGEFSFNKKLTVKHKNILNDFSQTCHDGEDFANGLIPGRWCKWVVTDKRDALTWSGEEKFYNYVEWLVYLIDNFFSAWGYKLNGEVKYRGEDFEDVGIIRIVDNKVTKEVIWGHHV